MRFIIARSASAAALDAESAATRGRSHSRAAASQTCTLPSKAPHLLSIQFESSGAPVALPAVRAPAGPLGVFFFGHRVTEVRSWSPLAGQAAVDDRLVSIDAPGRALFTCAGRNVTGLDIIHELRAGAASDGRVLTFGSVGHEYRAGRS